MGQDVSKLQDAQVLSQAKNPPAKTVTQTVETKAFDAEAGAFRYTFFKSDAAAKPPNEWRVVVSSADYSVNQEFLAKALGIDTSVLELALARAHVAATSQ